MEKKIEAVHILVIIILAFFIIGFLSGYKVTSRKYKKQIEYVHDTIIVTKTITETAPEPKTQTIIQYKPLVITKTELDTLRMTDTVVKWLPIEQKYYERLDGRLRMWVSGYQTSLDKWELDEQTKVVYKDRSRWGLSLGFGPAIIATPFTKAHVDAGWGLFYGLTYTF